MIARIWQGRTRLRDGVAEFMTISYWSTRDEIRAYAGDDIEKPHHLPKDAEYLIELPREVRHYEIVLEEGIVRADAAKGTGAGVGRSVQSRGR
jgi:hypothetical protein